MPTTLGINGSTISPTPSEVRVTPPRHVRHQMADGTSTVSKRTKGHAVMVTWGSQEAYTTAMAAVRTALGSNAAATLTWTDPSGTTTTNMAVVHEGLPEYTITINQHYGRFTHVFYEA
jgi:uncharacterized protein YndB with AHSA1/START domain